MPEQKQIEGVEILICTFGTPTRRCSGEVVSDFWWLSYCLRSIIKYCAGFQGVTLVIPDHERILLDELIPWWRTVPGINLQTFTETRGKGFLHHEIVLASADLYVPKDTKYVLTMDADGVFTMPTSPSDYFQDGKPYYLWRTWESLTTEDPKNPGTKVVSDCQMWKAPTDRQVGFDTPGFFMAMNTNCFPIEFFLRYRDGISKVHDQPFEQWMLAGRNVWPQDRMDHTAMGAWAHRWMTDQFTWIDVNAQAYPVDRKKAFWSHGGITHEIEQEIEGYLAVETSGGGA